jgi:hypothetical protein
MSEHSKQQMLRRPRHEALDIEGCRIWLELAGREPVASYEVRLVDLSRHGMQVRIAAPVATGEDVILHICDTNDRLDLALPGTARWQRASGEGVYSVGCLFDELVDYEVLGELFLRGILDMGRSPS